MRHHRGEALVVEANLLVGIGPAEAGGQRLDVTPRLRRRAIHLHGFAQHDGRDLLTREVVGQPSFELLRFDGHQPSGDDAQRVAHGNPRALRPVVYGQNASHAHSEIEARPAVEPTAQQKQYAEECAQQKTAERNHPQTAPFPGRTGSHRPTGSVCGRACDRSTPRRPSGRVHRWRCAPAASCRGDAPSRCCPRASGRRP